MPDFDYVALDGAGQEQRGTVAAAGAREAAGRLRRQQWIVLAVGPGRTVGAPSRGGVFAFVGRRPPAGIALEAFLRHQAVMLEAGLSLLQSLEAGVAPSAPKSVKRTASRLAAAIRRGYSFSDAVAAERGLLGPAPIERLRTAEVTGELGSALLAIAEDMERARRLRTKMRTALAYPAVVTVVAVGVALLLVGLVVPRFAQFFSRTGKPMPPSLQLLVTLSETSTALAPAAMAALLLAVVFVLIARRRVAGRMFLDRCLLSLPVAGQVAAQQALWRTGSSLAGLIQAGIPILKSLRLTATTCGNAAIGEALERSADRLLSGEDLAASLQHALIPSDFRQVISVGERSGELSRVLSHLAAHYEREVDATVARMAALAEPLLLILVGGLVGLVYVSFFQAIFQIVGG